MKISLKLRLNSFLSKNFVYTIKHSQQIVRNYLHLKKLVVSNITNLFDLIFCSRRVRVNTALQYDMVLSA